MPGVAGDRRDPEIQPFGGQTGLQRLPGGTAQGQDGGGAPTQAPNHAGDVHPSAAGVLPGLIAAQLVLRLDQIDGGLEIKGRIEGQGRKTPSRARLGHALAPTRLTPAQKAAGRRFPPEARLQRIPGALSQALMS